MTPKRLDANAIVIVTGIAAVIIVTTAAIGARGREHDPGAAPQRLSETGLYVHGTLAIDPTNRPYSPQYALWSDGAGKARWVFLPAGTTIDVNDVDAWDFPVGTKFWKEFAFNGRKVETRFLWKATEAAWVFASYAWNAAQTDATLVPEAGMRNVAEVAPNARHGIPSTADCRACHDAARTEILGFNALQLSTDRDPNAPHAEPLEPGMVTLRTLIEEGRLSPARTDLLSEPPRIPATDPLTRSALGYLSANCGHCHNAEGQLASVGLFLKHTAGTSGWRETPAARSAIGRPSTWQVPGAPDGATQIIARGTPDLSALLQRMRSRRPSSQMPPLGTVTPDRDAIALIESWIARMGPA